MLYIIWLNWRAVEWKYSPDLQRIRFRVWWNSRKMWLFFFLFHVQWYFLWLHFVHSCLRESCVAGRDTRGTCLWAATLCMTTNRCAHCRHEQNLWLLSACLKSARCLFFFCVLSENLSASDVGGGDICSSWSGVHSSVREKRLRGPDELRQEAEAGIWGKQPGDTSANEM